MHKQGIDFRFKIELHKGLKRLLRDVTVMKEPNIQMKSLGKVFAWYFSKLEAIGHKTTSDKEDEDLFLNPTKVEEMLQLREGRQDEKRQKLMNEDLIIAKEKHMYDEGQRSMHKDLPPAKDRIIDYKHKCFGKLFDHHKMNSDMKQRPFSGASAVASSNGRAEVTT